MLIHLQSEMGIHFDDEFLGWLEGGADELVFACMEMGLPDLRPTE
jgi:hypothetical protein